MYSNQETALLRKQFWTSLGHYLAPVPSAGSGKINWINYKTGVKFIHFRMDADSDHAFIGIELSHTDPSTLQLVFKHFKLLKLELDNRGMNEWLLEKPVATGEKDTVFIYQKLAGVSIYDQADWPKIISFFKQRIILLDQCWTENKPIFEMLL